MVINDNEVPKQANSQFRSIHGTVGSSVGAGPTPVVEAVAKGHQVAAALRLGPRCLLALATDMLLRMLEDIDEAEVASPPGDVDPGVNADVNVDAADANVWNV